MRSGSGAAVLAVPDGGWCPARWASCGIVALAGGRGAADLDQGDDRFRQDGHGDAVRDWLARQGECPRGLDPRL